MVHRIAALSAVSLLTLVYCGGRAVDNTNEQNDGSPTSGSSGGSGSSSGTGASGSSGGPDASDDAPACPSGYDGGSRPAPTSHRAQPGTCPATTSGCLPMDAGAGAACTTSADCVHDGSYSPYSTCLNGQCAVDACLTDSDCPSGHACLCGSMQSGNACFHANQCVPADCRLDSDCGAGSYCSPNPGACGIESGYHCHRATDSCFDDADCTCPGSSGFYSSCAYSSSVGKWVCTQITCAG